MTEREFQEPMQKLIAQWPQTYSQERVKLVWREIGNLPGGWWQRTVERFLGELRHAPLMPEIREAAISEREKIWADEKERHKREAERAMRETFDTDMVKSIIETITDRVQGRVKDDAFTSFKSGVRKLAAIGCKTCDNSGLVFRKDENDYEWIYRCRCSQGERQPARFPRDTWREL